MASKEASKTAPAQIQKDECRSKKRRSLLLQHVGFPRHAQNLGASRRNAGPLPALDPDIIAQEIVEDLQAALAQFAEIAGDIK
jgi:hypothetical protein